MRSAAVQHRLGDLLAKNLAAANLLGRAQIAKEVHRKTGKVIPIATSSRFRSHFDDGLDSADLSLGFSLDLPNGTAADHLRSLTSVTRDTYDGLSSQYKKDAFTVAGVSDVRLIDKVKEELAQVLQDGGTQKDFEAAVAKLTSNAGVEQIAAFTLDTVFTTNMQKAYSLGRYEQLTDPAVKDALPYWQYLTVGDARVRPEHAVLDYFTARNDDAVWRKIYPPNGFNCRCIVIGLLAEEAPEGSDESGMARLPLLAHQLVPQPGFAKVFDIAA
jgi:SPP1 gp7 family putative phage head morphogenesis protein